MIAILKIRLQFLNTVLLIALVCLPLTRVQATVLATVNDDSITTDMMAEELGRIHMMQTGSVTRENFSPEKLLQKLINNRLIVQEAETIGLEDDPLVTEAVSAFREKLAYRVLLKKSLPDTITVSEEEIRREFEQLYGRYDVRFLCVLDSTEAVKLADSIRHGAPMDQIARAISVDKYKNDGGLSSGHTLRELPVDLRPQFIAAHPGDLFGPFPLWRVWATLRFEARHDADTTLLDSVRSELAQLIRDQKRNDYRRQYIDEAGEDIRIDVDSVQVDSLLIRMQLGIEEPDVPAATVAGKRTVMLPELRKKYIHRAAGTTDRLLPIVVREVLQEQIDQLLLKEIAARQGDILGTEHEERLRAFTDSLLVITYLNDVIAPSVKVSDADISDFYEQNKTRYVGSDQYKVASLTRILREEIDADFQLAVNGTDFAWLAKRNSIDPYKEQGGERNWEHAGTFPEHLRAELDSLPIGGVTQPSAVDEGFAILRLVDRKEGELLPFEQVEARIRSALEQQKQFEAIDAAIQDLRASAEIHIDEQVLQELNIVGPAEVDE